MTTPARILQEHEFEDWDRFVESVPDGSIYSTTAYLAAFCDQTGGRLKVAAIEKDGRFEAGVALLENAERWGTTVSPRSLMPYNGFVVSSGDSGYPSQRESSRNKALCELAAWLEERNYLSTTIRTHGAFLDARVFDVRGWRILPTFTYVVGLRDLDAQWSLVDRDLKRQIRRAGSSGFTAEEGDDIESLLDFHDEAIRRKHFSPYLPRAAFESFFRPLHANGLATIFRARSSSGQPAAAQLVLTGAHNTCHVVAAGSDPEFNKDGVNAFLRWQSFQRLAERGYQSVDLTDASLNAVSKFKSRFGGELVTSLTLRREGGSPMSRLGVGLESVMRRMLGRA